MTSSVENLLARFDVSIDHRELLRVMHEHFRTAAFEENGTIAFPAGPRTVLVVKAEQGVIRWIHRGSAFDAQSLQTVIETAQRRLVESPGRVVSRTILHSSRVIAGYWRSEHLRLQIFPAPPPAPQPPVIMADHPFVLETEIMQGGDGFITNQRLLRAGVEWGLVLNAILRVSVKVPDPRGRHLWIYDDASGESRWLQAGYFVPGLDGLGATFTAWFGNAIPQFNHDEYYESWGPPLADRDLAPFPRSMDRLLSSFASLDAEHRDTYLRAARWIRAASDVWILNASSWFTAMVSAIETFVPRPTRRCPTCNSMIGITQNFRDFVEKHSPRSDHSMRQTIYSIRSGLSHGSFLLRIDATPWAFSATFDAEQRQAMDDLQRIVRDVMVNWLLDHESASGGGA